LGSGEFICIFFGGLSLHIHHLLYSSFRALYAKPKR